MSSDQKSRRGAQRSATQKVVEAYQRCLEAREQYIAAMSASADSGLKGRMHRQLHQTVLMYFEALNPHLKSRDIRVTDAERDEVYRNAWEEARLWSTTWKDAVDRQTYENLKERDDVDIKNAMEWPEIGIVVVAEETVSGLKRLEGLFEKSRSKQTEIENMYGSFQRETTRPQLIDVAALFRIARYLDQAAKELNFLGETPEPIADAEEI